MESIRKFSPRSDAADESDALEMGNEPLHKIGQALTAAASSLAEARCAFEILCGADQPDLGGAATTLPVLLTVPQVCNLLGYRKTKVYSLMKRGLLPYIVQNQTGHRRIEYAAIQQLVKRLRGRRIERKVS